jgi:crossover junction endodeoxyribonuclease RuvC
VNHDDPAPVAYAPSSTTNAQSPNSRVQFPTVLGIDPGLRLCGWGVVRGGARPEYLACGVIRPRTRDSLALRLRFLHEGIGELIAHYEPDEVAIEDPFVGALAPASALAIGQARAMALLAGAETGLEVALYAPAAVKSSVSGYGASDKRQVQSMVRLLLGLTSDPEPSDAADALAVAICHLSHRRARELANGQTGNRAIGQSGKRTEGSRGSLAPSPESKVQSPTPR